MKDLLIFTAERDEYGVNFIDYLVVLLFFFLNSLFFIILLLILEKTT